MQCAVQSLYIPQIQSQIDLQLHKVVEVSAVTVITHEAAVRMEFTSSNSIDVLKVSFGFTTFVFFTRKLCYSESRTTRSTNNVDFELYRTSK